MAPEPLRHLLRRLRHLADPSGDGALTDAQLLDRYLRASDEAAFEVLVWRHGAMVWGVCRRLLRHEHDAEDAFQATFLLLARKAASIRKREALAGWLYKIAYRVALTARDAAARRGRREQPWQDLPAPEGVEEVVWSDLRPILDEEIRRLPEKYRAPFILCHLQGLTNEEAAGQLGCPKGTILSRLSRARERLRLRLERRGVTLTAGALAVATAQAEAAALPARLVDISLQAALAGAAAPAPVAALTEGVLRAMFLSKLKITLAVLLAVGAAGVGVGTVGKQLVAGPGAAQAAPEEPQAQKADAPPAGARDEKPEDPIQAAMRLGQSQKNLKMIALAMHNYHDTYRHFPAPALYSKDGRPLFSWRVALLPFLKEVNTYQQLRLDEPWDSAHNRKLLEKVPKVFAAPGGARDTDKTYYQAIVGTGSGFEPRQGLKVTDFFDGTSNTILVVEAATPVPWAKPEDLPYVPDQALPKFGGLFHGDFNAAFADGSVSFLSGKADETLLRAAITRNGGEVYDFDKLHARGIRGAFGANVSAKYVADENAKLKDLIQKMTVEIDKATQEVRLQQLRVELNAPNADRETLLLLQENAKLREQLEKGMSELDHLKTLREQLEKGIGNRPEKKAPDAKPKRGR